MVDPNLKNKSVLIIDDDKTILNLLGEILQEAGIRSVQAPDGSLGMLKAKNEKFDLIITDLNMPKMNGIQFLRNLYSMTDWESKNLPVIVISGDIGKFGEELKKFPLVSLLEKPFDAEEFVKLVYEKMSIIEDGETGEKSAAKKTTLERTLFAKGQLIYGEGTDVSHLWMVAEGKLLSFHTIGNHEVTLLEHLPGEIVGVAAVLSKKASNVGVRALEDSLLVKIPTSNLLGPLATAPKLLDKIIADLVQQQLVLIEKLARTRL